MSNAPEFIKSLSRRRQGQGGECTRKEGGRHVTAQGGITRGTAIYTNRLCRAIIGGMTKQLRLDGRVKAGEIGIFALDDDAVEQALVKSPEMGYSGKFKDDLTNQVLRDDLVVEARRKELDYFCSKGVWLKRPKERARRRTGRAPISVRWVDVNKGDDANPRYRSRLVARQLKAQD